jgi:hexosaminidase
MHESDILLLPRPQKITLLEGQVELKNDQQIAIQSPSPDRLSYTANRAREALSTYAGLNWQVANDAPSANNVGLLLTIDPSLEPVEAYRLTISSDIIHISGHGDSAIFYGVMTLVQLLQQHGRQLPQLKIEDWPDLPNRGVMLDISRDKVPTMETIYGLIDMLATWKINQFQLYTEHTFAYQKHPKVWAKSSPITAEESRALDAYCRERFIDLVPNQSSFGHMHRWFEHEEYMAMAEAPEGFYNPWGRRHELPYSLSPANPDSFTFMDELYAELLPNFTSQYFNVNCDETFDLGQGRSKAMCEERGQGRVYLDFLMEIYRRVKARGRTMQYWGDIIGHYPDLVPELPKDAIALEWGYEADHDFPDKARMFGQAGVPFYVCPGTSSWCSVAGRTDNAIGNIRSAVENGLKNGAIGILNTDWGDGGHWQQLPTSYLGFAYGAALGWAFEQNVDIDLPAVLNAFALGNTYQQPDMPIHNGSALFWAYNWPLDLMENPEFAKTAEAIRAIPDFQNKVHRTIEYVDNVLAKLDQAQMARPDAELIKHEYRLTGTLLKHAARRLLVMVGDDSVTEEELESEFENMEETYRDFWTVRNRPGGLDDSIKRMTRKRALYE